MVSCVLPRKKYEDETVVLFQAKEHIPQPTDDMKQSYMIVVAKTALQEGYDTIQLVHEAQLGCDKQY